MKKKHFLIIGIITVLCLMTVIAAIASGKSGEWIGNKKTPNQSEVNFDLLQERTNLKDYFALNLYQDVNDYWVDGKINVREMNSKLITDLNRAIKSANVVVWERKFIAFIGGFNIENAYRGRSLDTWIKNNPNVWIIISKNHCSPQFRQERNVFYLKKGEPDYREFGSKNEAIDWLRNNDGYFKS